jgi:Zn-dependent peptidase ImmA (M78 family)
MSDELLREDVAAAIDGMVDELLDRANVTEPPVDVINLAQHTLGMLVCLDRRQPQRGRAQRTGGRPVIYLRPEPREERHQWTVAHEIGEHLKVELLRRLGLDPAETRAMTGESLANLLAYRLLVPSRWFADDARALDYDLLELKKRYGTSSHEVIALRFVDLPDPCIVTVVDNDKITRRKSNAWPARRKLEPAEAKCQRLVHERGRPTVVREADWTVHGWPVHQLDWKREILRSVIEES